MDNTSIQTLDKLLVEVPIGSAETFKKTYYSPDEGEERKTDYDNKVAFLHDTHEIFTKGDIFGGRKTTVGDNNSFDVSGTKYTLTITDEGELNIDKYTPSHWGTCSWTSTTTTGGGTQVYQTWYNMSITPSNKFTARVQHETTSIAITGTKVKDSVNTAYTYIYGGEATIQNGIAYVDGTAVNYSPSDIVANYTLNSGDDHYIGSKSEEGTLTATKTLSVASQTAVIYYHEMGKNTLSSKQIVSDPNSVTVTATYSFLHLVAENWNKTSATETQQQDLPIDSNITFTFKNNSCYGWFACPTSWFEPEPEDGMPMTFTQYDAQGNKGAEGGWRYALDGNGQKIRFTHAGVQYTLFRTENPVLATAYYRVSK